MKRWLATFGGLGLLPGMPGTYASLAAAIIFFTLWTFTSGWLVPMAIMAGLTLLVVEVGRRCYPWARQQFQKSDPGCFVLDEVMGQWITLMGVFTLAEFVPHLGERPIAHTVAGFILFRAFDVAKPWPIRNLEKYPGALGVFLDDFGASVYAIAGIVVISCVVRQLAGPETLGDLTTGMLPTLFTRF